MKPAVKWTLIGGIVCTLVPPFAGFIFTVIGMIGAFHALGQQGIANPGILAGYISLALSATAIGIVIGLLGLPIIVTAVVLHLALRESRPPGATHSLEGQPPA